MANTIRLTWGSVDGAVEYNVYHNTSPKLSIARTPLLTSVAALTYDHTGLEPGSLHYYIIVAVGPNNELSAPSTEIGILVGVLLSIVVTPSNVSFASGVTHQYTATGHFNVGSPSDITSLVFWDTNNHGVATIDSNGLLTAVASGTTSVTALLNSITGSTNVSTISLVSIVITPTNPSISIPNTQQFTAIGHYSDSSTANITSLVIWTSGTTSVGTINSSGLFSSVLHGTSLITATLGLINGNTTATVTNALVSIVVTPANATVIATNNQQYTAIGHYSDSSTSDITSSVTWLSSNTSIADINIATGLLVGHHLGSSTISATLGVSGNTNVNIVVTLVSIDVEPALASVSSGSTQQYSATGTYNDSSTADITNSVVWSTDDAGVATIDGYGLLTGVSGGDAHVHAVLSAVDGNTLVTITSGALVWTQATRIGTSSATLLQSSIWFDDNNVFLGGQSDEGVPIVVKWDGTTATQTFAGGGGGSGLAIWGASTSEIWLGGILSYFAKSTDGGITFTPQSFPNGDFPDFYAIWGYDANHFYVSTNDDAAHTLYFTANGGSTFNVVTLPNAPGHGSPFTIINSIAGNSSNDVWVAGQNGYIATFDGSVWTQRVYSDTAANFQTIWLTGIPGEAYLGGSLLTSGNVIVHITSYTSTSEEAYDDVVDDFTGNNIRSIAGLDGSHIWAAATDTEFRFRSTDDHIWHPEGISPSDNPNAQLSTIAMSKTTSKGIAGSYGGWIFKRG